MKKVILLMALLLLLTGCASEENLSINDKVANQLLKEIDMCDSKFESDSRSYDYCELVFSFTKQLIDDEYFSDGEFLKESIIEKRLEQNITSETEIEFESFTSDIIGTI